MLQDVAACVVSAGRRWTLADRRDIKAHDIICCDDNGPIPSLFALGNRKR